MLSGILYYVVEEKDLINAIGIFMCWLTGFFYNIVLFVKGNTNED